MTSAESAIRYSLTTKQQMLLLDAIECSLTAHPKTPTPQVSVVHESDSRLAELHSLAGSALPSLKRDPNRTSRGGAGIDPAASCEERSDD
jgi:hypothetical protein